MRNLCLLISLLGFAASAEARQVMFLGVDVSGSFVKSSHFKNSLSFAAHYIYAHLNGHGGFNKPKKLFVGAIGGAKPNEPKTFHPIEVFENKSIRQIERQLIKIFPAWNLNPYTDYRSFFEQVETTVKNRKLIAKPIEVILLTDGVPDAPKPHHTYQAIDLKPLEYLSRRITVRVLYTSAGTAKKWQDLVPRCRVRLWTQDANVMKNWNSDDIFQPKKKFAEKERFFNFIKENIDFKTPVRPVQCKQ